MAFIFGFLVFVIILIVKTIKGDNKHHEDSNQ